MTKEEYNALTEALAQALHDHIDPLVGPDAGVTLVVRLKDGYDLLVADDKDPKAVIEFLVDGYNRNYPGREAYDTPAPANARRALQ